MAEAIISCSGEISIYISALRQLPQLPASTMYEKWYFHGRYKNCICIADADDLDFPQILWILDILWFWS